MQEAEQPWERLLVIYKKQIGFALVGILLISIAILISKKDSFKQDKLQILQSSPLASSQIKAEIAGAVNKPGVYSVNWDARVDDLIAAAGGFTDNVDQALVAKIINRAARVIDGQKIFVPSINQQSDVLSATNTSGGDEEIQSDDVQVSKTININTANQKELESLWGIGPVTAQKIIEQRPYSDIQELITKKIVKSNVFEKIKDQISVY